MTDEKAAKRLARQELAEVRAGKGLMVHFPTSVFAAPGRRTFVLQGDEVITVDKNTRFVRRRLHVGDLLLVKTEKKEFPATTEKPAKKARKEQVNHDD